MLHLTRSSLHVCGRNLKGNSNSLVYHLIYHLSYEKQHNLGVFYAQTKLTESQHDSNSLRRIISYLLDRHDELCLPFASPLTFRFAQVH